MRLLFTALAFLISVSMSGQISFCGTNLTSKDLVGLEIKIFQTDNIHFDLEFTLYDNSLDGESTSSFYKWLYDPETNSIIIDYNKDFITYTIPITGATECSWVNKRRNNGTKKILIFRNGKSFNFKSTLLTKCVKSYVESNINVWLQKGEFEKLSSYNTRVNNESRLEQIQTFQSEALNLIKKEYVNSFFGSLRKPDMVKQKRYDPENETFLIQFIEYGSIVLNVPIKEGPYFSDNFSPNKFKEVDFVYDKGHLILSFVKYIDSATSYEYSISEHYNYNTTEIEYDFEEINLNFVSDLNTQNITLNNQTINSISSSKKINFQSSDATFDINSIAVIPNEIKSCDGTISSADELASFTETNILSHYNVTDRRHLESILDEHRLQMSGLTFEKTLLASGCIENAQAYLFVQSGCLMGDEMIEIRLVHCETSTLVWSCTGINASPQEVLAKINEELSE